MKKNFLKTQTIIWLDCRLLHLLLEQQFRHGRATTHSKQSPASELFSNYSSVSESNTWIISKHLSPVNKLLNTPQSNPWVIQELLKHFSDCPPNTGQNNPLNTTQVPYLAAALLRSSVHLRSRLSSCPLIFSLSASSADCAILPPSAWSISTVAFRSSRSRWSNCDIYV